MYIETVLAARIESSKLCQKEFLAIGRPLCIVETHSSTSELLPLSILTSF